MKKEEISIKVSIADVVYPLRISLDEEENVRKAAKLINDKIRIYREDYRISDKANLLSMVALQFANELLMYKERKWIEDNGITEEINEIERLLDEGITL
ncbi:MAG: cell division protein ZapA [Bacteroidia bacterium]